MSVWTLSTDEQQIGWLTIDSPDKVNLLSTETLKELQEKLKTLPPLRALVLVSAKESFIAGADVKQFRPAFEDPDKIAELIHLGHDTFDALAALPMPTIAMIHGFCLGGGMELALACDFRVATDDPSTRMGLPEVKLGIFPGWGGTQRLPRLIGLLAALPMLLTGKLQDGKRAKKLGLVDALVAREFQQEQLQRFLQKIVDGKRRPNQNLLRRYAIDKNPLARKWVLSRARKQVLHKTKGHYPVPLALCDLLDQSLGKPLEEGLRREKLTFIKGIDTILSRGPHMIHLFFATEAAKKEPAREVMMQAKEISSVGVLGAGTMGAGIAWLATYHDKQVRLKDVNWECLAKGYRHIEGLYRLFSGKLRKISKEEANRRFHHLSGTTDYRGFSELDFVIEAASEKLSVKKRILAELEEVMRPDAIIATNTSSLPVEELAAGMRHPERFLAVHFFNPVDRMPLVEVAPTEKTDPQHLATVVKWLREMKKSTLLTKPCPGLAVNRIFTCSMVEALWLLEEGESVEKVDRACRKFGLPMGPFEVSDQVGTDIGLHVVRSFEQAYGARYAIPSFFQEMVERGLLGKKSAKGGFYLKQTVNPALSVGKGEGKLSLGEITQRLVYPMVNEGYRAVEEGVVSHPDRVDMATVMGTGFPPFRGGLMHYAETEGREKIRRQLQEWTEKISDRFAPCGLL